MQSSLRTNLLIPSLACLLLCFVSIANADLAAQEYAIKAAFLEKFTHFISWPDGNNDESDEIPFTICVLGGNPFGDALERLAQATSIHNRDVAIDYLQLHSAVERCAMLFISPVPLEHLRSILDKCRELPVLTIADSPEFARHGVMINFYRHDSRIGFEINLDQSQQARFRISSRLLKLARIIESGVSPQ